MYLNLRKRAAAAMLALALLPAAISAQAADPEVAPPFRSFYTQRQGARVLGAPLGGLETANSYYAQYFEKGLLEDHRGESSNPEWQFLYARLAADLLAVGSSTPLGGDSSDLTYASLQSRAGALLPSPYPNLGGAINTEQGVFVPFNAELNAGPGHYVSQRFWESIAPIFAQRVPGAAGCTMSAFR